MKQMTLTECPRDAMQGIRTFIPTDQKIRYLNQLLRAGFHTLDFGSFVSAKAIPQLRDTPEVLAGLDLADSPTRLLAIVANARGAADACAYEAIHSIGFPFSVSETFQMRNTNSTLAESLERVTEISRLCRDAGKELVLYLSMGFGNPYGDPYHPSEVATWTRRLHEATGTRLFAPSDTIGVAGPELIQQLFTHLTATFPELEFGAHLHTTPDTWKEKVQAAWDSGCRRFDGALKGLGGCPMAADDLTGNMATEHLVEFCGEHGIGHGLDLAEFHLAMLMAGEIFPHA